MATAREHPAVAAIRKSGASKVKVAVSDIDGVLRGKYLHRDKFLGTAEPYPKGGFGFCDVVLDGTPHPVCPRQTLKRVLKRAEKMGFQVMTGMEFEWYNFAETPQSWAAKKGVEPEPLTPGMFGYSLLRVNQNRDFFNAIMDDMLAFGVPVEGLHTETGPGVYEAAIGFSEALEQADRAILFKTGTLRHHAQLHGQAAPAFARLQRPHPPEPVGRQEQSVF